MVKSLDVSTVTPATVPTVNIPHCCLNGNTPPLHISFHATISFACHFVGWGARLRGRGAENKTSGRHNDNAWRNYSHGQFVSTLRTSTKHKTGIQNTNRDKKRKTKKQEQNSVTHSKYNFSTYDTVDILVFVGFCYDEL